MWWSSAGARALEDPRPSTSEAAEVRRIARETKLVRLSPRRFTGGDPLRPVVISVIRNERLRLPDFLRHYRRLGVRQFLFIDNGSTDGSRELLAARSDVDLFAVAGPFSATNKHGWITRLVQDHGSRWYFLADADEHAAFHGAADLRELAHTAQRLGSRRVRAMLLDMYGNEPLTSAKRRPLQSLLDAYPFFDPTGYLEDSNSLLTSRFGGPRRRALSEIDPHIAPQLTKYPLFRLGPNETLVSPHYIDPPLERDDPCFIALLHFKFDNDAAARIADAVATGQYWRNSYEYRVYREAIERVPGFTLMSELSRRYESPADLVRLGIIDTIPLPATRVLLKRFFTFIAGKRTRQVEGITGRGDLKSLASQDIIKTSKRPPRGRGFQDQR